MITGIRNINFINYSNNNTPINKGVKFNSNCQFDTVSFSGADDTAKLTGKSLEMVKKITKKMQLNKIYKFDNPNVEKFQMTTIANKTNPNDRTLFLQYSGYSRNNMAKFLMCAINDKGEIFENGTRIKNPNEVSMYENILPPLIKHASKVLKVGI